jgi:hypothetical protein
MKQDKTTHNKKQVYHQIAFLEEHRATCGNETGDCHFEMKDSDKQGGQATKGRKIADVTYFMLHAGLGPCYNEIRIRLSDMKIINSAKGTEKLKDLP